MSYKNISLDTLKNDFGVVVKHLPLQLPMSQKAEKEEGYYQSKKYVRMAGHIAYIGCSNSY